MVLLIAVIAFPLRVLIWIVKHPRILVFILVIIGIIIGVRTCSNMFNHGSKAAEPAVYQEKTPSISNAPYVVATDTRLYYVRKYTDDGQVITLEKYYTYDTKKWKLQNDTLPLDRKYYPRLKIYERKS